MKFAQLLRLTFTNLGRRKGRSFLAIWAMSVGIGAMALLVSFAAGLQQTSREQLLSGTDLTQLTVTKQATQALTVGGKISMFSEEEVGKLRALDHVRAAYVPVAMPGLKATWNDISVDLYAMPTPVEIITDKKRQQLEVGSWWERNEDEAIVLSAQTLEQLKVSASDVVGKTIKLQVMTFTPNGQQAGKTYDVRVSGVFKKNAKSGFFSLDAASHGLAERVVREDPSWGELGGSSSNVEVIVDDSANVAAVRTAITDLGWHASGLEEILDDIDRTFRVMKIVLGAIGGIALFVALIGITNAMLMAVLERTREIGVFVALGASRRTVARLFLIEAGWLGLLGAVVGLVGAFLIGQAIVGGVNAFFRVTGRDVEDVALLKFHLEWVLAVGTLVGSTLLAMFAAWAPARRAAKQDPVTALRHE